MRRNRVAGHLRQRALGQQEALESVTQVLHEVEAVDDRTLKISFSTPNALFLNGLADFRQAFVPPEVVQNDPRVVEVYLGR